MRSKFKWIFTLLIALSMQFSFAQEKTVTGTITDGKLPLPGANVVIKGTTKGVSADMDGKYSIKAKPGDVLVISFAGYDKQSVTVGSANSYNVKLSEGIRLDEVLVTGAMGIKRSKEKTTTSQQVVGNKELTQANNPNLVRSLAGKVSGLQIDNTSSGVNGQTRIVLRGARSISGNVEALVVIDGAISSAAILQQLPPDIVESVNVIKGASGAALYGEAGANGVFIVTTKKGTKNGKLSVSVNSSIDFENISFLPEKQMKYGQGWDGGQVNYENGGWGEPLDGSIRDTGLPQADGSIFQLPYSPIKDNLKAYYKTGTTTQNGVTFNFGGEDSYVMFTANRQATDFIVEGDQLKRNSFIFKGGKKIGKWNFDGSVQYINSITSQADADNTLEHLLQAASNIPIELFANSNPGQGWTAYYTNPFWQRKNNRLDRNSNVFYTSANLGYKLNKNIDFSYLANLQTTTSMQESHANEFVDTVNFGGGDVSQQSNFYSSRRLDRNYYGVFMTNLNYMLGKDVSLKANIGFENKDTYRTTMSQGGKNLQIPGWYHIQNVLSPDLPRDLVNNSFRTRSIAAFVNVDLGYKDFLFLNLTAREEKASQLLPGNNAYFYPSAGLSFVATKAFDVLKDKKTLNYAKLYANMSQVGNASSVKAYDINSLSGLGYGYPFGGLSSYGQFSNITNPQITPEYLLTKEAGINLGFLEDRLTFNATVYRTDISKLISASTTSSGSGFTQATDNIGNLVNKGYELELGFNPFKNKDFSWEGRISYTTYDTKVTDLGPGVDQLTLYNISNDINTQAGIVAAVGQSFPAIYGTTYQRDDAGHVIVGPTGMPLTNSTRSYLGKVTPDYIVGFSNSISYKGLKLTAVMDFRTGHSVISGTKYNLAWAGHLGESADFDRDLGFIYPNSVINTGTSTVPVYTQNTTVYTAAGYGGSGVINYYDQFSKLGEAMLVDATTIKVRELALSYSLPSKVVEKLNLASLRFGINARNPFIFFVDKNNIFKHSNNRNFTDPEASNSYSTATSNSATRNLTSDNISLNGQGYSQTGQYPSTRTFGFSVNLTF